MTEKCLVVTGAAGRIGLALRAVWGAQVAGLRVLWSARRPGQGVDIPWDIGAEPPPALPSGAILLHLAGQTRGTADALAENRRSAAAVAQVAGLRHLFFMSSAAVYRPGAGLIDETCTPDPDSDYGRAKLAAEAALGDPAPRCGVTILRLGNLAGADSLLSAARRGPVVLDPIPGQKGGPERSYIGPQALATALAALIALADRGQPLPPILNLAQAPAVPMAALLTACGADWRFGPPRPQAVPRVALSVARLARLVDLPAATPETLVADLTALKARWP